MFTSETEFERDYKLGKELGRGAYATVRLAIETSTKQEVAVKCVVKKKLTREDEEALKVEVAVLQELRHPGVVALLGYYEEPKNHYLVLELMSGGELFTRIVENDHYSEGDAQRLVKTVAEVLEYCHGKDVAHRDLKPENILLKDRSSAAVMKIADFGFARHVNEGCRTACGTPGYVAPEVISGKIYDYQCDVWSLGVLMYILLCGYPPFYAKNRKDLFRLIRKAKYSCEGPGWELVSGSAKDLISKMLVVDSKSRLTASQVVSHPWVLGQKESDRDLKANVKELRLFNARRHLRAGFKAAIVAGRLQDLVDSTKKS